MIYNHHPNLICFNNKSFDNIEGRLEIFLNKMQINNIICFIKKKYCSLGTNSLTNNIFFLSE